MRVLFFSSPPDVSPRILISLEFEFACDIPDDDDHHHDIVFFRAIFSIKFIKEKYRESFVVVDDNSLTHTTAATTMKLKLKSTITRSWIDNKPFPSCYIPCRIIARAKPVHSSFSVSPATVKLPRKNRKICLEKKRLYELFWSLLQWICMYNSILKQQKNP